MNGQVTFTWKNYKAGGKRQQMTLSAVEFLRRFLLHVLPKGFVRIRRCGWWTNRHGGQALARCRELLGVTPVAAMAEPPTSQEIPTALPESARRCGHCNVGIWLLVDVMTRPSRWELVERLDLWNTS